MIYVIKDQHDHVKIGISSDPIARLASLQTAASTKLDLCYVAAVKSNDGFAVEQVAHNMLVNHRTAGEWFNVSPEAAVGAICAASYRLNDPVVSIPVEHVSQVIALARAADLAATPIFGQKYRADSIAEKISAGIYWFAITLFKVIAAIILSGVLFAFLWLIYGVMSAGK